MLASGLCFVAVTAIVKHGAQDLPAAGSYVAPTLFAGVDPDHALAQDEIFGPVQAIIPFEDEAHAIAIANGTDYGLVASVWSENGARQMRMARALRVLARSANTRMWCRQALREVFCFCFFFVFLKQLGIVFVGLFV